MGLIEYKNVVVTLCDASTYSSPCYVEESDPTQIREVIYVCMGHELSPERVFDFEHSSITLSEARGQEEERRLKEIKEQRTHLQAVSDTSNTLLNDLGYSLDAIQDYDMAKKYGNPVEAYKALSRYGDLKSIEAIIENLLKTKTEHQLKIKEMYLQLQGPRGQGETVKESVSGLLKPLATEITKTVEQSCQKLTSVYTEQSGIIKKGSEEYAKRLGAAKFLEEELKLARVISAILKHPAETMEFSLDYVLLLLEAVEKLCWARGLNPKIS